MALSFAPARPAAVALCAALVLATLAERSPAADASGTMVEVHGRNWLVAPLEDGSGHYKAERLNRAMLPFRQPALLSARQASRAFRAATGCSIQRDSLIRTISGVYIAALRCPPQQSK